MSAQVSETYSPTKKMLPAVTPRATYRLQLNHAFTFRAAMECVPYLAALNVSHLYLSPIFRARRGSTHGYDVISHSELNPEIGSAADFARLAEIARQHDMGIIIDIVPNHMAVMADDNVWWSDVLENGPAANFANYFDIDWWPARASMRDRLLIPILGRPYGDELRNGNIKVIFDAASGNFQVQYGEHRLPLDPKEYSRIFRSQAIDGDATRIEGESTVDYQEFESLLDDFEKLPPRSDISGDVKQRRYRDKEVYKRRLARLAARSPMITRRIDNALLRLNGIMGKAQSFEALADLLAAQPYRLAFWKVAGDEINYRRFFDVNQLAALRVEESAVFNATHQLVLEWLALWQVEGVRIDHVDGLHYPKAYLSALCDAAISAAGFRPFTIVEKILASHERLREDWKVDGTTGYEFGTAMVQWLLADDGMTALEQIYRQHTHMTESYDDLVYRCKKLIMRTSLAAEIAVLAGQLDRIAQAHPDTMDFTHFSLRDALTEVIACFPVYRTYIAEGEVSADDRQSIAWAVGAARKASRASDRSIFDFIEDVLLGKQNLVTTDARREDMLNFTMKFQQVSSPVMAKSVEDTSFYRYVRLLALNEVGADPRAVGLSNALLHKLNQDRANRWPNSLLATSTHDSKRGEDVRYRLAVISEVPREWREHVRKWSRFNRGKRKLQVGMKTSLNDEYFFLQTILGVWPMHESAEENSLLTMRLKDYALKAIRESKVVTSWIDPEPEYEAAMLAFVDDLLSGPRGERFRAEFGEFAKKLAFFGMLNGLSALVLKCTAPGIPDFYQGTELPELTLVDPDNRRAIDFDLRCALLKPLANVEDSSSVETVRELMQQWGDGRIKLWMTYKLLKLRKQYAALFASGDYEPLVVSGKYASHAFAFARHFENISLIVVASRWTATLAKDVTRENESRFDALLGESWADTRVHLSQRLMKSAYINLFTHHGIKVECGRVGEFMELKKVFAHLPFVVLQQPNG